MKYASWIEPEVRGFIDRLDFPGETAVLGEYGLLLSKGVKNLVECTSIDSERFWTSLKSLYPQTPSRGQFWFVTLLLTELLPIDGENYVTEGEAKKWLNQFGTATKRVLELLNNAPASYRGLFTEVYFKQLRDLVAEDGNQFKNGVPINSDTYQLMHMVIDRFNDNGYGVEYLNSAIESSSVKFDPLNFRARVNSDNAPRTYFVRGLARALLRVSGQKKLEWVARATSIFYDCQFTAQDVWRETKGIAYVPEDLLPWESKEFSDGTFTAYREFFAERFSSRNKE